MNEYTVSKQQAKLLSKDKKVHELLRYALTAKFEYWNMLTDIEHHLGTTISSSDLEDIIDIPSSDDQFEDIVERMVLGQTINAPSRVLEITSSVDTPTESS